MLEINEIQDIQNLIDGRVKESQTLEYKEARKSPSQLMKDVSAFANTYGGVILFGVGEKNGIPISFSWVRNKGMKETIENMILTNIQPKLDGYMIKQIDNPEDDDQSVFAITVQESINAPHMADKIYYARRKFQTRRMEDTEVKNAIFKKGYRDVLLEEIDYNEDLADKIIKKVSEIYSYKKEKKLNTAFVPFRMEAWKSAVYSGLFSIIRDSNRELVDLYNLIYETNFLIDFQKCGCELVVTQIDSSLPEYGTYLPRLIQDRSKGILSLITQFKKTSRIYTKY